MLKDLPWKVFYDTCEEARALPLKDGTFLHVLKNSNGFYDIYHDIEPEGAQRRAIRSWYELDAATAQCIIMELHRNPER